jgi:hypothetical protein
MVTVPGDSVTPTAEGDGDGDAEGDGEAGGEGDGDAGTDTDGVGSADAAIAFAGPVAEKAIGTDASAISVARR